MLKIYSKGCEHVLSALSFIPVEKYAANFLAQDLCEKAQVSETSTRKSLQILVREGILNAIPGPGGGYKFAIHPDDISLFRIIQSIDGPDAFDQCVMGLPECGSKSPCPLHETWQHVKEELLKEMTQQSLGEIMRIAQRRKK